MAETKKTKAMLLEEIGELRKEIEKLERYKAYEDMADECKAMFDSFVRAGFSEDQAFKMLSTTFKCAAAMFVK